MRYLLSFAGFPPGLGGQGVGRLVCEKVEQGFVQCVEIIELPEIIVLPPDNHSPGFIGIGWRWSF